MCSDFKSSPTSRPNNASLVPIQSRTVSKDTLGPVKDELGNVHVTSSSLRVATRSKKGSFFGTPPFFCKSITRTMGGAPAAVIDPKTGKKKVEPINLLVGATLNIFEVSTLGQPFEVLKTHLAANRGDSLLTAFNKTRARGGFFGFCTSPSKQSWKREQMLKETSRSRTCAMGVDRGQYKRRRFDLCRCRSGAFGGGSWCQQDRCLHHWWDGWRHCPGGEMFPLDEGRCVLKRDIVCHNGLLYFHEDGGSDAA